MSELVVNFRLPVAGWPQATFRGDHAYRRGRLSIGEHVVAAADNRADLERGVSGRIPDSDQAVELRLERDGAIPHIVVCVGGRRASAESELRAPRSRSAWIHALLALAASAAGFTAGYLYLGRAAELAAASAQSVHATKMAIHMAGWHLLLTFTLFPASLWGQRPGIRTVQSVSFVFLLIHLGIALANAGAETDPGGLWIGVWNTVSGGFFLAAVLYGNVAYRDMDPVAALTRAASR